MTMKFFCFDHLVTLNLSIHLFIRFQLDRIRWTQIYRCFPTFQLQKWFFLYQPAYSESNMIDGRGLRHLSKVNWPSL
jgi:hypothetical protein